MMAVGRLFILLLFVAGAIGAMVVAAQLANTSRDNIVDRYAVASDAPGRTMPSEQDLEASNPDISCRLEFDGARLEFEADYFCDFRFKRSDALTEEILTGRIPGYRLVSDYLNLRRDYFTFRDLAVKTNSAEADVETRISGSWGLVNSVVTSPIGGFRIPLTESLPRDPARSIRWTVTTQNLDLVGVGGAVTVTRDGNTAMFVASTRQDIGIDVQWTNATSGEFARQGPGRQPSDLLAALMQTAYIPMLFDIVPLALFVLLIRRKHGVAFTGARYLSSALLVGAVTIIVLYFMPFPTESVVNGWLIMSAAPALLIIQRSRSGQVPVTPRATLVLVLLSGAVLFPMALAMSITGGTRSLGEWLGSTAVAAMSTSAAIWLVGARSLHKAGAVIGLVSAASASVVPLLLLMDSLLSETLAYGAFSVSAQMLIAAPLALLTWHVTEDLTAGRRWLRKLLTVGALAAFLSIPLLLDNPAAEIGDLRRNLSRNYYYNWASFVWIVLLLMLLGALREEARRSVPYRCGSASIVIAVATAVVLTGTGDDNRFDWDLLLGQMVLPILVLIITRHRLSGRADDLGDIRPAVHVRLVRAEIRRRRISRAVTVLLRSASDKLAEREIDWRTLGREIDSLESIETPARSRRADYVSLSVAAFSSSGGASRLENLRKGALLGFVLSIPIATYEVIASWPAADGLFQQDLIGQLNVLRILFKGAIYGALGGYYYPLLRGTNPILKFSSMLLFVVAGETVASMNGLIGSGSTVFAWLFRIGTLTFFFLTMGILWERRLAWLANVPWIRVRDFRTLRALVAPVTTVLVAGATVLITILTTAVVSPAISPPPQNQPPPSAIVPTSPPSPSGNR